MGITEGISLFISLCALGFSVYFSFNNKKNVDVKEIERRATERAETNVKLDNISNNVQDIKYDISDTKKAVERVAQECSENKTEISKLKMRVELLEAR